LEVNFAKKNAGVDKVCYVCQGPIKDRARPDVCIHPACYECLVEYGIRCRQDQCGICKKEYTIIIRQAEEGYDKLDPIVKFSEYDEPFPEEIP